MGSPVDDVALCKQLMEDVSVMLVPGSRCFGEGNDFKGYVRIPSAGDLGPKVRAEPLIFGPYQWMGTQVTSGWDRLLLRNECA